MPPLPPLLSPLLLTLHLLWHSASIANLPLRHFATVPFHLSASLLPLCHSTSLPPCHSAFLAPLLRGKKEWNLAGQWTMRWLNQNRYLQTLAHESIYISLLLLLRSFLWYNLFWFISLDLSFMLFGSRDRLKQQLATPTKWYSAVKLWHSFPSLHYLFRASTH